jgi:hypothetical protein
MKKLGDSVLVGFKTFKVLFPYTFKEVYDYLGQCDNTLLEIRLKNVEDEPVVDDRLISIFMHELVHAIEYASGHRVFKPKRGEEANEDAVDGWAEYLCMVLRDNQWILELFLDDDKCIVSRAYLEELERKVKENAKKK